MGMQMVMQMVMRMQRLGKEVFCFALLRVLLL